MADIFSDRQQEQDQNQSVKIGRLRMSISAGRIFMSGPRPSGFSKSGGVLIRASYRYHKGQNAKSDPGGRMRSHLQYLAGQRRDQIEKGTNKDRQLYSSDGRKIEWKDASKDHAGHFIEHRIIISPAGNMSERDVHTLAQASIQEIQSRHPAAEITASYSVHSDSSHRHAHLLITSPNALRIDSGEYKHLREFNMDMRSKLEQDRNQNINQSMDKSKPQEQTQQKGQGQELSL